MWHDWKDNCNICSFSVHSKKNCTCAHLVLALLPKIKQTSILPFFCPFFWSSFAPRIFHHPSYLSSHIIVPPQVREQNMLVLFRAHLSPRFSAGGGLHSPAYPHISLRQWGLNVCPFRVTPTFSSTQNTERSALCVWGSSFFPITSLDTKTLLGVVDKSWMFVGFSILTAAVNTFPCILN